jgi:hypothetical protein
VKERERRDWEKSFMIRYAVFNTNVSSLVESEGMGMARLGEEI